MGIAVLPLALFIGLAWLGLCLLIAFAVERFIRKVLGGNALAYVAYPLSLYLGCWIPNIPGHNDQARMNEVAKECGWTTFKKVENVRGIFVDGQSWEYSQSMGNELAQIYSSVEYEDRDRIAQLNQNDGLVDIRHPQFLTKRTFHLGVRDKGRELAASDIWREELLVVNFDTQEILGKRVEYGFVTERSSSTLLDYAVDILTYQAWPCGHTDPGRSDIRTELPKILVPTIPPKYRELTPTGQQP